MIELNHCLHLILIIFKLSVFLLSINGIHTCKQSKIMIQQKVIGKNYSKRSKGQTKNYLNALKDCLHVKVSLMKL